MATADQLRQRLLRDGRQLLATTGHGDPGPVTVIVTATVEIVSEAPPAAPVPSAAPVHLPPLQSAILSVLTATPALPRTLAQLCGRKYGSRFREGLRHLVDKRLALRTSKGYSLP